MEIVGRQERSRRLAAEAEQAIECRALMDVLDAAGSAILEWSDWREPYCLIARVCYLRGDAAMGDSYVRLARSIPRPTELVLSESLYVEADLDGMVAQWRSAGLTGASALRFANAAIVPAPLRLVAGGDVMLGRQMPGWVGLRGPHDAFSAIAPLLRSADLTLVNLETCVSTEGDFLDKGGRQPYYYHNLPEMLDVLTAAGISCLSTANNHAMDYGAAALAQQNSILDACGFLHFGAGKSRLEAAMPKYARVKGATVAFIGVETETSCMVAGEATPGIHHVAIKDLARVIAGSIAIARAHADIVIVSPHWGQNWEEAPTPALQESARLLIELGADAIMGHSAHILQGVEFHAGRPIVYDMGTLLFDRVAQSTMKDSALFELEWDGHNRCQLTIRPVKLSNARAKWAVGDDFQRIHDLLMRLSKTLDPKAAIESVDAGLRLSGQPAPSPMRKLAGLLSPASISLGEPPQLPANLRNLKSNLVYATMPAIDGSWSAPVTVNANLEILGARFASPVRPGRGFICEIYFRAAAPAMPSRVEARIVGLTPDGQEGFAYTHPVAEGIHPPARWRHDEIICDRIVVRPVKAMAAGIYKLCWSLVDLAKGDAMPIESTHERLLNGQIYIGDLVVSDTAPNGVAGVAAPLRLPRADAAPTAAKYGGWQGRVGEFWDSEARPWTAGELVKIGLTIQSSEVVRDGSWSLVVRVATEQGAYFFKALESPNRFEAGLLALLSAGWPDHVVRPLAVCVARAWILTPDYGDSLLKVPDRQARRDLLRDALPRLAEMQIDTCGQVDRLLALGVPDRRLERLPDLLERLLANAAMLTDLGEGERRQVLNLLPEFRDRCAALARETCSAGLDHGDLHYDNVCLREGRPILLDWDTASVTHPFCSLLLPYDVENLRNAADLARKAPLGEAYLAFWEARTGRSLPDLVGLLHRALWVGHVVRALFWADISPPGKVDARVAKWLRLWLKNRPLLMEDAPQFETVPPAMSVNRPPKLATADNPLLLDKATIARITGGTWHNVPDDALITGVSFNRGYLAEGSSGNLYFAVNADVKDETFKTESIESVRKALKAGAVAAVVPGSAQGLPEEFPLLRVDRLMPALDRLGLHVRDHLFTGKRVLVSGTEGKTGFKNMLHHVLAPQISTHATTNSSNLGFSILASFASIRRHDRIAIIEAAGTHPGRLAVRSEYVQPHMFVLTEVGNEHLNYHGSQQAVIESKADIVTGLVAGGYGLLNADGRNYAAVRKSVLARRRVPLLLFGSGAGCNGRLIDRRFEHNHWITTADIEGQRMTYRLPLLGEHAPLASVSVLLAAYYLGADVEQAAAAFCDYQPYESQGVLRRIAHGGGEILCYDNASRASVLSYQSALRMAARLAPPTPRGKKIAVIGQMIFLGKEAETWHARLAEWIDDAQFDRVILVGKYTEVTFAHLRNPDVIVRRFPDYDRRHSGRKELQALIDALDAVCAAGDLLFIKGEVDELGQYLQARQIPVAAPRTEPAPAILLPPSHTEDASALSGLRPLALTDLPLYRSAIDQTQRTVWQHYFPFIYLLGQSHGNQFLVEEDAGSLCLYYLREKKDTKHLCLFLLPIPLQTAVLERCIERLKAFNCSDRASLFRVDADDVGMLRGRAHTRLVSCPEEYIYAPANYLDLSGNKKRNLRRAIQSIQQRDDLEVLDYQSSHADECRQVLDQWAALQREKYGGVLYGGFTQGCLEQYEQFSRRDLFGKVIRLDGKVCSFGFAGEMRQGMGNLFITYSDLRIDGLNKFLYYCLLRDMEHLEFANASHAGDTPGLAFAKQALGPAFLYKPYQVYAG